jgi:hypothetical protein
MNALDHKQVESMRISLDDYSVGRMDLRDLVSNLEIMQSGLGDVSENWRESFRLQWGILEEIYSVAVVREEPIESEENRQLILDVVDKMRQLIDELVNPDKA